MSAASSMITSKSVDLTNCGREQVQFPAAIQPHGVRLVLQEPELLVLQASRKTSLLLGIPAETLLGSNLRSLFAAEQVLTLRELLPRINPDGPPLHVTRGQFGGRNFDVLAHRCNQSLILEFEEGHEAADAAGFDLYSGVHNAISTIEATESLQSFLDLAAREIRYLTKFNRVMIYKFMEDKSGWVRSEALTEGMESYLDLHYPASDIPEPARRLFSLTWVRHQPDIAYTPVPMVPENNPLTGKPLDMSYALLRSVSIMYIDYLKNMGTRASPVMTLLKGGKLWELIGRLYADLKRHAELDSFAYVASHHLKEPLRGISNFAETICNDYPDKLDEAGQVKLATINRLCRRVSELLDSPHAYSRLGEAESLKSDVDLNDVVSQALDLLQVRVQAGDVAVRIPSPLPTVKGDRGSGAGLTIIRKIIQRLGGRIWLQSIVGQGSTFYFTLGGDAPSGEHS